MREDGGSRCPEPPEPLGTLRQLRQAPRPSGRAGWSPSPAAVAWGADRSPMVDDHPHAWRLRLRWRGVSRAARLRTPPQPRSETARGPRLRSPKGATGPTHKVGRPPGASSPLVHVRLPRSWRAQLERSLERRASQTGGKATRGMMARRALERVRARDEAVGPPRLSSPPLRERDAFHRASLAVGPGRDCVRMHRLRASLAWPRDRLDPVLQPRAAAYVLA